MPKLAETRLCDDWIALTESDELACAQLRVSGQWFKNIANVIVGDPQTLPHHASIEMRAALVVDDRFHGNEIK
jgi:hypothetical protein